MSSVTTDTPAGDEWTVDQLAQRADVPVRTIREYQTMGLLPGPRRSGRIGLYNVSHLRRLQLIDRLQVRGHSLAGIGDLLASWREGDAITDILGLEPDQLVHIDEPGAPATLAQLTQAIPALVPDHLDELLETGVVEGCGPDRYCVPSPSLLQLAVDTLGAGLHPNAVLELLVQLRSAADAVADATLTAIAALPQDTPDSTYETVIGRGRGLLAHGVGRLSLHRLGRRLAVDDHATTADLADALRTRPTKKKTPRKTR